jgi:hypothetical protein
MAIDKHKDKNSDDMILKPDLDITFGNKDALKRSEETGIPLEDERIIALMEGDVQNESVDEELAAVYASTISHPDQGITYPDHASLKKRIAIIPMAARFAAAAVILLLVSIGVWLSLNKGPATERAEYALSSLKTKAIVLETMNTIPIQYNIVEEGTAMIAAREEYVLSLLKSKDADPLQIQYALTISYEMSGINFPGTLDPAPSTYLANTDEPKKRTLMGKVFNGMFNRVKAPFERNEAQAKPGPEKGFSIWDIAEFGLKGVSTLGDHDYTLVRDYNEKGKVRRLVLVDE